MQSANTGEQNKRSKSGCILHWAPCWVSIRQRPLLVGLTTLVKALCGSQESFTSHLSDFPPPSQPRGQGASCRNRRSIHVVFMMFRSGDCEGHGKTFSSHLLRRSILDFEAFRISNPIVFCLLAEFKPILPSEMFRRHWQPQRMMDPASCSAGALVTK